MNDLIDPEGGWTLDNIEFNEECAECGCPYYEEWLEPHPYGSTVAYEEMADCTCQRDCDCPRIQEHEEYSDIVDTIITRSEEELAKEELRQNGGEHAKQN